MKIVLNKEHIVKTILEFDSGEALSRCCPLYQALKSNGFCDGKKDVKVYTDVVKYIAEDKKYALPLPDTAKEFIKQFDSTFKAADDFTNFEPIEIDMTEEPVEVFSYLS